MAAMGCICGLSAEISQLKANNDVLLMQDNGLEFGARLRNTISQQIRKFLLTLFFFNNFYAYLVRIMLEFISFYLFFYVKHFKLRVEVSLRGGLCYST